jgi:nanoRNase/pAp phosphatase (c-di-AMP/oligoRNAs hydrolase)
MTRKRSEPLDALLEAVADTDHVLILPHNDPDPDAIASAVALRHLLEARAGVSTRIAYRGLVGRAENKAMVNYLERPLRCLRNSDLKQGSYIALVDTQPGAGNNALPPGRATAIVLDHHPLRKTTPDAAYHDVREDVGATSTMLIEYLQAADLEPSVSLATALFYGIKTDTMGLSRGARQADVDAYFYLQPRVDIEALVRIERAQVPAEYFESLVAACRSARRYGHVLVSYLGWMSYPDLAAEMADLLLRLKGVWWVICVGAYEDDVIVSVRTNRRRGGAARVVRAIVRDRGTAGGHGSMAGGQIPLAGDDPDQLALELGRLALASLKIGPYTAGEPILQRLDG